MENRHIPQKKWIGQTGKRTGKAQDERNQTFVPSLQMHFNSSKKQMAANRLDHIKTHSFLRSSFLLSTRDCWSKMFDTRRQPVGRPYPQIDPFLGI
jgi:hypothetical protein